MTDKSRKKILFASIAINIFFIAMLSVFVFKKGGINYLSSKFDKYVLRVDSTNVSKNVNAKSELFKKYKSTGQDIYFVGDSITEQGQWSEYFPELSCRNRGIGGEGTTELLTRLSEVISAKPKKIFLLIGINDLLSNNKIENISSNYSKILDTLKTSLPETEIYVESVLPINEKKTKEIFSKNHNMVVVITNRDISILNTKLQELCREKNIKFIDLTPVFKDNEDQMNSKLTYDGVHLELSSYLRWSEKIKDIVYK